jgi:glycosyltransferase involved in cell wall biosynthesis
LTAVVVVPTYNEAASLEQIIRGILSADAGLDVLVVDDASPDGTGAIADELAAADRRVHVLHRPAKAGLGSAYRDAFGWTLRRSYDPVCQMDADGSHDPGDLPGLLGALAEADVAVGSRYVPDGRVENWPRRRLWLSAAANRYVRLATRVPVVLPQRITAELIRALRPYHPLWVMTHFNHPGELTPHSERACRRLADGGFPVMNHSVLLAGVNDDAETLAALTQRWWADNQVSVTATFSPAWVADRSCDSIAGVEEEWVLYALIALSLVRARPLHVLPAGSSRTGDLRAGV